MLVKASPTLWTEESVTQNTIFKFLWASIVLNKMLEPDQMILKSFPVPKYKQTNKQNKPVCCAGGEGRLENKKQRQTLEV